MSNFKDMCVAFEAHQDRIFAFFRTMQAQARVFRDGYAQSIQAPSEPYEGDDGRKEYVRLLQIEDGEFADAQVGRLFREADDEQVVWFGLAITVERNRHTTPKRVYTERVGLKWLPNAIEVRLPEIERVILAPRDGEVADYADAYAAITKAIMDDLAFDPLA
ncbi:hypothetical protein [Paraburkholderia aspalathi]|uniref:hypothetical protein n=1 Tax=Paraburkholderia aspalathi TaxID=1324617 RepID=UPI0019093097|nr:hypothetical protein [Paraburkholderia aspalathi]MBK3842973.1 hypothetical protein [Paraburkholderia aspalathi]